MEWNYRHHAMKSSRSIILMKTQYLLFMLRRLSLFPSGGVDTMKDAAAHCVSIYALGGRCSTTPEL
jgi:hypothetical protein